MQMKNEMMVIQMMKMDELLHELLKIMESEH